MDLDALSVPERQAGHLINVGRGLAQVPTTARDAIAAFRRARRLTPMRVRLNPHVRVSVDPGNTARSYVAFMDPYGTDPRHSRAACPRCTRPAEAGTGGWSVCTGCGLSWPAHPVEVGAELLDDLGAASLTVDRLRRSLTAPAAPLAEATARHLVGRITSRSAGRRG